MSHPSPSPSAIVVALSLSEPLRVDAEPILRLRAAEGLQVAEATVARARDEIGHRLGRAAELYAIGSLGLLQGEARGIAESALSVGLADLTRAARHVADCAGRNDPAGLAATLARLLRLGDRALTLIGSLRAPG